MVLLFYRREIFSKYGYFDETLTYKDLDFWLTVSRKEHPYFMDDIVVLYRRSETSISRYQNSEDIKEKVIKFNKMYLSGRDTLRKHTCDVEDHLRNRAMEGFYLKYMENAIRYGIKGDYKISNQI